MSSSPRPSDTPRARPLRLKIASWLRWLHIYLSMFSLLLVLFFSATGLTLNHPDWFGQGEARPRETEGKVNTKWLASEEPAGTKVARLEVVEALRKQGARGALDEFRVDETECLVSFKAPGYSSDTYITRRDGTYRMTTLEEGAVAFVNDLHKGRHAGRAWSWLIDFSAGFLVIISLTGLGLMFYLKRLRVAGLLTALAGILVFLIFVRFLVP